MPVYSGFDAREVRRALKSKMEPSYMGMFTSTRRHVLHTFAHTESAAMKKSVSQFMLSRACPLCHGTGNTVVVIEHDMRVVAGSDWMIDIGPGAGDEGGRVVAAGTPEEVCRVTAGQTARYLARFLAAAG